METIKDNYQADFIAFFKAESACKDLVLQKENLLVINDLQDFTKSEYLPFSEVEITLEPFKKHLMNKYNINTAVLYYNILLRMVFKAIRLGLIINTKLFARVAIPNVPKGILTKEEISMLMQTPCKWEETKRMFILCCLTGLRLNEAQEITWNMVTETENGEYLLSFVQPGFRLLYKASIASDIIKMLGGPRSNDKKIFDDVKNLPSGRINRQLQECMEATGINKHVTFSSARKTWKTLFSYQASHQQK